MTVFEKNNAIENAFSKVELVGAYIRVSTQEQKLHGISLDAQVQKIQKYADDHNMRIVEWYKDEGVSGRKLIRNRPELQRMIQDAEMGKFTRILFIKLDRFFRSVAEYHECMKRISPVIWTATEEQYDLSTANGRMLVNMKLTVAELEADMAGERISLVNEYKTSTGQPLTGKMPFGFKIVNGDDGRKKIVKDAETMDIVEDAIDHYMTHQSKKRTLVYLHTKYHISLGYNSLSSLLKNPMLCGTFRDNPSYCEAYMTREEFNKMQEILRKNVKENTAENRAYLFSGLIVCPLCKRKLSGAMYTNRGNQYKKYRCYCNRTNHTCDFNKTISENAFERLLLDNIEQYLEDAKIEAIEISEADTVKIPKYNIEEIHEQIDRLNYSWQTGKIRKVEQYEKDYTELMEKLEKAEAEQGEVTVKDFSKIEAVLHSGWRAVYENLDDAYKRAWWRSFIKSIEITWTTDIKRIDKINFF